MASCRSVPQFSEYATHVDAVPSRPPLNRSNKFSRTFPTRLSDTLRDDPVNFAGHYIVATFGCGSSCLYGGIIDAQTGRATALPWIVNMFGTVGDWDTALKYQADSRLLVQRGALDETDGPPLERYFEWRDNALRPICARRLEMEPHTGMAK